MKHYFAAANTERGFVSWFDHIFDPDRFDRVYIIKGGSGTGKSTLMKRAAARAEAKGAVCEGYLCSSDPASLDGVIIDLGDRRIAMLDGTAPHTVDPKLPGAVDEIVNLGKYWCADILSAQRGRISALARKKAAFYKEAYADFRTAGTLLHSLTDEAGRMFLREKAAATVRRMLTARMKERGVHIGGGETRIRVLSALSCGGEVTLHAFDDCDTVWRVTDMAAGAPHLFDTVLTVARELSLSADVSPTPLIPEYTEAIRFPELSLAIVSDTERTDARNLNMARFIDRELYAVSDRQRRRAVIRAVGEMKQSGLSKLAQVKRLHGELEAVYIRAMDFTLLEEAAERLYTRMGI